MKERGWIGPIVERVVGEVLDSHAAQLRIEIVRRVMDEIAAEAATEDGRSHDTATASGSADLARAVAEIHLGSSQREILRALLDTSARYAERVALFVVKGSHATGWQGRGFAHSEAIKDFALDENAPAVGRAIGDRLAASTPIADLDPRFLEKFGAPASGEGRILPLMLKDKVAALVYADGGTGPEGSLDAGSLELLVLSTSAWLEVNSLRKQAHKEPSATQVESHNLDSGVPAAESVVYETPAQASPAIVDERNDPFGAHAPAYAPGVAMAAAASAGEVSAPFASAAVEAPIPATVPVPTMAAEGVTAEAESATSGVESAVAASVVELDPAFAEPLQTGHAETVATPEAPPVGAISPEDQDVHRKAQRFSRLLVDEIKLYNQAKVAEGRRHKDLYDRLQEAIEKSRATYQRRYGSTVAASGNYFQNEILRSLAEDDLSVMGANFRQ